MAEYVDNEMMDYDPRIDEAKKFLRQSADWDSNNRSEALEDLNFSGGSQWPVEIQNSRTLEARPCLTINKLDAAIRQICNQQRQQRPRIKVHGMNSQSDEKIAEVLTGICRHIENQSDADQAYDHAFEYAVRMGWGYLRIETDYMRDDSFDQEIYIRPIRNPFTVYYDPNSVFPDGSDAEKVMVTEVIPKDVFRNMYPNAPEDSLHARGTGDMDSEWIMKEDIRIAEYFYIDREHTNLLKLSDNSEMYEDDVSKEELDELGLTIIDRRETVRKRIKWIKLTANTILEEGIWPGKYIPIVPVYGNQLIIENKHKKYGITRMSKDSQRMYNFWVTSITESVALAPKPKWLIAEGQDEGHEAEWAQANIKATAVLRYKQTDIDGRPAQTPVRIQPEAPPTGVIAALSQIDMDLKSVLGVFDPNQQPTGNISGKALNGQQQQIDLTNYNFYDNLTRSIRMVGKIILDLVPHIYDTQRVMRIIGDDGKPEMITINERNAAGEVVNNVTVGEYDVVMDTGPGYNSKRAEAVDSMMPLFQKDPNLMQVAGDLFIRNMDFPGADVIADRLASMNPLAKIDDKSDIPPRAQMMIAQAQQQVKQMQQQMQAMQLDMKYKGSIEQFKQGEETKRELMRQHTKAHDTEMRTETMAQDTIVKTESQKEIEQMKANIALILAHINSGQTKLANAETTERAI